MSLIQQFLWVLLIWSIVSCSGDISGSDLESGVDNTSEKHFQKTYDSLLVLSRHAVAQGEQKTERLVDSSKSGAFRVYYYDIAETRHFPEVETFGRNDDILWPGQILNGYELLQNYQYAPASLMRTPIEISLSLEAMPYAGNLSRVVLDPKLSSLRSAIRDLLAQQANVSVPTELSYSYEYIYDQSQLKLCFSSILDVSVLSNTLGIDWNKTSVRTRIAYTFKMRTFSVDVNTMDSVFSAENSVERLREFFAASHGVTPVYVSSVDYGAVFYMVVESDLDERTLTGALQTTNAGNTSVLKNTTVRVAQFGGPAQMHDQLVQAVMSGGGIPKIRELLEGKSLNAMNAVPIAYQLRYLDNHEIARVALSSQYRKKVYLKVDQSVRVTLNKFEFLDSDGAGAPEGYSVVKFYKVRGGIADSVSVWRGGVEDVSPNFSTDVTFTNFDPRTDKIRVSILVVETDAFDDDIARGNGDYGIEMWDGSPVALDASGDGAASRITLSFSLL